MIKKIIGRAIKPRKLNLRKGTLAHEDFMYCMNSFLKEHSLEWSDLDASGQDLLNLFENYKDDEINKIIKKTNPNLPDIKLPTYEKTD